MIRKRRKTRKYRGSRRHGYGDQGQHRGGGQRGGSGRAGFEKHHWIRTVKYEPERIRKVGFTRPTRLLKPPSVVNLGQLDEAIPILLKDKIATEANEKITINLADVGVGKLLGKGSTTRALNITVNTASAKAIEKIKKNGGKITLAPQKIETPPNKDKT
ncbi:MAG: uL15m family ribosomal protein [Candidatus Ranarchaeia archaeon]